MTDFENKNSLSRLYKASGTAPKSSISAKVKTERHGLMVMEVAQDPVEHDNSSDQDNALARIEEWLMGMDPCFTLVGPAGSGKTHLLKQIMAGAKKKGWYIKLSAPTHQAAARIREATNFHAETTHRLLSVSLVRDKKTGNQSLKAQGTPDIMPRTLLVIDEASMNPAQLTKIVIKFAEKYDCKVLFVGDAAQLNPVKEKPSITVDKDTCEWGLAELTTIHRQAAENPIIALATAIRLADPNDLPLFETAINGDHGIVRMDDKRAWADLMVACCGEDSSNDRYIGYENKATDAAAKAVRAHMYGADAAENPYLVGERLVVNARYVVASDGMARGGRKGKKQKDIVIENNEQVTVKNVWNDGEYYHVQCDWNGHHVQLKAFENYTLREAHLAKLKRSAIQFKDWSLFFDASDTIADLRSATTITAHKSQGSTFGNIFLNLNELGRCYQREERKRLLYVALTRASECVYVTGAL